MPIEPSPENAADLMAHMRRRPSLLEQRAAALAVRKVALARSTPATNLRTRSWSAGASSAGKH
ncbi:MAG: hypothetical protein HY302_12045 [Opitutae bacterium]|nr:hypothetical protein [Opitutae bacterium]